MTSIDEPIPYTLTDAGRAYLEETGRSTSPLLASLVRGPAPASSEAYRNRGVVVVGRLDRPIRSSVPDHS
jgi:hypothetical protein